VAQTHLGAMKAQAKRLGLTLVQYLEKLESGYSWCWKCKTWKLMIEFYSDKSRHDGIARKCISCACVKTRLERIPTEDRHAVQKAHDAIRNAIKRGQIKPVTDCIRSCGKPSTHYHHHRGYRGHELDVVPLCMSCHFRSHYVHTE
jgi:hypothetical protein